MFMPNGDVYISQKGTKKANPVNGWFLFQKNIPVKTQPFIVDQRATFSSHGSYVKKEHEWKLIVTKSHWLKNKTMVQQCRLAKPPSEYSIGTVWHVSHVFLCSSPPKIKHHWSYDISPTLGLPPFHWLTSEINFKHTLPKFNIAPEKLPKPNGKGLSSNHQFSEASC